MDTYRVADPSCHPRFARLLIWPPSEMTKSRTCHLKKWQSHELATTTLTRVGDCHFHHGLSHFRGRPVKDYCVFSGFWRIGKIGGGKKDQPPCTTSGNCQIEIRSTLVLPSRKSDHKISKSDYFLPKIRPKAVPKSLFPRSKLDLFQKINSNVWHGNFNFF